MRTLGELVELKLWEEFYITDKGDVIPKTKENTTTYLTKNPRWSLVTQPRPITTQDAANKNNPLSTTWRDLIIKNNHQP